MEENISNKTIAILTIAAVIVSVLSVSLGIITVSKVSDISLGGQESTEAGDTNGQVSLSVPTQPSEAGAFVGLVVN